jgi:hypothetical protein
MDSDGDADADADAVNALLFEAENDAETHPEIDVETVADSVTLTDDEEEPLAEVE